MVRFSDWVQLDDYTAPASPLPDLTFPTEEWARAQGFYNTEFVDSTWEYGQDAMERAFSAESVTPFPPPELLFTLYWDYHGFLSTDTSSYSASMMTGSLTGFTAFDARRMTPQVPPQPWPDGAVGYMWESYPDPPLATVVGAVIPDAWYHMTGHGTDTLLGECNTYMLTPSAYLDVVPDNHPFAWPNGLAGSPSVNYFDAANAVADATVLDADSNEFMKPGKGVKFSRFHTSGEDYRFGAVDVLPLANYMGDEPWWALVRRIRLRAVGKPGTPEDDTGGDANPWGTWTARAGFSLGDELNDDTGWQPLLTMRPPRFRWVYEADNYTRVHPRDDGRGTASAGRVHPPPRSQQGSSRVGPGSYT